ncbi:MAG: RNA-binding domain-containing protein [Candidatus Hadarchaeaceae archaeon]
MKIRVETEVRETESLEKVDAAVKNMFPKMALELAGQKLVGESTDITVLSRLHQLLRQQAILDTARSTMLANRKTQTTKFMLNKQAAFAGKVSFTDGESPLGPIIVTIEAPEIERLIDYLAPRTRGGKPIIELTCDDL